MKRFILYMLLGVLSICSSLHAQVSSSKWQDRPIIIDGDGSDWETNPRFFNAESNMKYEFRNDAQNLYLIIKSADRAIQLQLLKAGFNIKLKVKTSPPLRTSITFPSSKMVAMQPMTNNQGGDKLIDKSVTNQESMARDSAVLDGFQYSKGKISSENSNEKSIRFARSKSQRELTYYEICIPLRELFGNNYTLETISSIPIQLQVNINDLSQNEIKKMRSGTGKGRLGGMGNGGMGGMGGQRNGGMSGDLQGQIENDLPGGNVEGEMGNDMPQGNKRGGYSMERKSFSIDFHLATGK